MNSLNNKATQLALLAGTILYAELAIIRTTAAEVLYVGFFTNFVLIAAFIGIAIGFLSQKHSRLPLRNAFPFALLFYFALILVAKFDTKFLLHHHGLHFFSNFSGTSGLPGIVLLPILFLVTAVMFAALAEQTAACFQKLPPLRAYTFDIVGSLAGIALFALQSYLWSGPAIWVATLTFMLMLIYTLERATNWRRHVSATFIGGLSVIILLFAAKPANVQIWSPYQKLEYENVPGKDYTAIFANGAYHQAIRSAKQANEIWYSTPYKLQQANGGKLDDVLIIGAGAGTDVALALAWGAKQIDAVEIDPGIIAIGRQFHPDKPYNDERVTVIVEDGRFFMKNCKKRYDLILYALPDSLVLHSPINSVRLESFLFTVESFQNAKSLLKDNGTFVLYNQFRWPWIVHRLGAMMENVFGYPPIIIDAQATTFLAIGSQLRGAVPAPTTDFSRLATDNWPFLYMQRPTVHWLYLSMIAMFLGVALLCVWLLLPRGSMATFRGGFFFMGAAFMLLETKSVALFSLLFGTSWSVYPAVFAGILTSVLLANLLVQKMPKLKGRWLFPLLFAFLAISYLLPPSSFLFIESTLLRYATAIFVVFVPVFLANLIFSREFRNSKESTQSFGWNILGAVLGGGMEYLSLLIGFHHLLWLVAACYLFAAYFTKSGTHD